MKICEECVHARKGHSSWLCWRDVVQYKSPVTGAQKFSLARFCDTQREVHWLEAYLEGKCGPQARFFVAKEKK